jgi:DNA mismatch repair protein MutS
MKVGKSSTPMKRQYQKFKRKYPDCLILFRVGDFFELFGEDAKIGAKVLGITLTSRSGEPLAGVPVKAVDAYLATLVKHEYKVAIVDQLEDASEAKGLVKRGVTRIITPGTITESSMLESCENNYLVCIVEKNGSYGFAIADASTGEFQLTEFASDDTLQKLKIELTRLLPAEILIPEKNKMSPTLFSILEDVMVTPRENYYFSHDNAYELLLEHFETSSLEGFGCEDKQLAISAAGALLAYLQETQKTKLANIRTLSIYPTEGHMILDQTSLRSLELLKNARDNTTKGTLVEILDQSSTAMGGRFIRKAIRCPLTNVSLIEKRHEAVEQFVQNSLLREELREKLGDIQDLERLASQISLKRADARDLISVKNSLKIIPEIKKKLKKFEAPLIKKIQEGLTPLFPLISKIEKALKESPASSLKEGGLIKKGYNQELDEFRSIAEDGRKWLLKYELEQKSVTGIKALKIGFNHVLGYYIQIGKNYTNLVPEEYTQKQELKSGVRFITSKLKEYEAKILKAKEQTHNLEYELFCELRETVYQEIELILQNAAKLAELDCLITFAAISRSNNYVRPEVDDSYDFNIKDGRHPVVEHMLDQPFIPNDANMNCDNDQLLIITGPNMSGKCVTGETIIFSEKGMLPIIDFQPNNSKEGAFTEMEIKVLGREGIVSTSHFYYDGQKPTIRITTKKGYTIEGSHNHPVLVRTSKGDELWKKLPNVQKDDFLIINRRNDLWGTKLKIDCPKNKSEKDSEINSFPKQLTDELAYFMGLLVGSGRLKKPKEYQFIHPNKILVRKFIELFETLFDSDSYNQKRKDSCLINNTDLLNFFDYLELTHEQADKKTVPTIILTAPRAIVRSFLLGLFDTIGSMDTETRTISFITSSLQLAQQLQIILLNFGIISSYKLSHPSKKYQLEITDSETNLFHKKIGFSNNQKRPLNISRNNPSKTYKDTFSSNYYFYDEIVELSHSQASLYDFSVPKDHSFIGNGFVNHNSTYIRQIALITLLAQIGCFVPADEAKIGVVDRIFTRIGASDDISKGLSTFLVEMNETANILNNATKRSLIILDEVGRGTSTFDGVSIAWAVAEYIHNSKRLGSKTLFATHYHQLINLENYLPRVKNYSIRVKKKGDNILFLHKIVPGGTDRSYGIQVAKLSGMPDSVISRAKELLAYFEQQIENSKTISIEDPTQETSDSVQTDLFGQLINRESQSRKSTRVIPANIFAQSSRSEEDRINEEIISDLRKVDINYLTPVDALNKLQKIKERIEKNYQDLEEESE